MGQVGLEKVRRWKSLISSERLRHLTIESAKVRLLNAVKTFVCTSCWDFYKIIPIKELEESFICSKCASKRIGVLDITVNEVQQLLYKKDAKYKKIAQYAGKTADLMAKHGVISALVLAGKNIYLSDAEDILSRAETVDDNLFELIIEAEKKALARKFW